MSHSYTPTSVCVIGLGYIGLPTASMFATHGFMVHGVDTNPDIVKTLKEGRIHIEEPGLATVVKAAISSQNLKVDGVPAEADVFIIAVPTPYKHTAGEIPTADMSYVKSALESIIPKLRKKNLVILESTSPPGTTRELVIPMIEKAGFHVGGDIGVAYCPERVIPGQALKELIENDRVVGAVNQGWGEFTRNLYRSFVSGEIFITTPTVAEMVKIVENTFRDVNVALANEVAIICEKLNINVWEVIQIANRHPRVNVHKPGPGVGGHCISVDPWFLVEKFPKNANLIHLSRDTNDRMPAYVVGVVQELLSGKSKGKLTVLGLAYKGNVDDSRESPAIAVVELLKKTLPGFELAVYDPLVKHKTIPIVELKTAFKNSDLAILLTAHDEFKSLDPNEIGPLMKSRVILDTHNLLKTERWLPAGFSIRTLGDGTGSSSKKVTA